MKTALGTNAWGKERGLRKQCGGAASGPSTLAQARGTTPVTSAFAGDGKRGRPCGALSFWCGYSAEPPRELKHRKQHSVKTRGGRSAVCESSAAVPQAVLPLSPRREERPLSPRLLRVTEKEGALVAPSLFGVGTVPNPSFHSRLGERDDPLSPRLGGALGFLKS